LAGDLDCCWFFDLNYWVIEKFVPRVERIKNSTTVNKKKNNRTGAIFLDSEWKKRCGFWKILADPA